MAKSDYDIEKLSKAYSNVNILETKVSSIIDDINTVNTIDKRIIDYYNKEKGFFEGVNSSKKDFETSLQDVTSFRTWLSDTCDDLGLTIAKTQEEVDKLETSALDDSLNKNEHDIDIPDELETSSTSDDIDPALVDAFTAGALTLGILDPTKPYTPPTPEETPTELKEKKLKDDPLEETPIPSEVDHLEKSSIDDEAETQSHVGGDQTVTTIGMTEDVWNSLTPEQQAGIIELLQQAGYSDEEINQIISGVLGVPALLVNAISEAIQNSTNNGTEAGNYILDTYGINIFNSDGSINLALLAMLLLADLNSGNMNIVQDLIDTFGLQINNIENVEELAELLAQALAQNPNLRQKIKDKYGIDIFNDDGTVNIDNLKLLLIMDGFNADDNYDIVDFIQEVLGINSVELESAEAIGAVLVELLSLHPELRQYFIDTYGIDIFNEDGSINMDALKLVLLMIELDDTKKPILQVLHDEFGVEISSDGEVEAYALLLLEILKTHPEIIQAIIDKYGINILNPDGTINLEKLKLLITLCNISTMDDLDLLALIHEYYDIDILTEEELKILGDALAKILIDNPALRQLIIDKYGFDILNPDGTINIEKLKLLLTIDGISNEETSVLDLIIQNIDTDVFVSDNIPEMAHYLEELLKIYPELRQLLLDKYGIDIFNEDGTINIDALKLIVIMDSVDDESDLIKLLESELNIHVPSLKDVDAISIFINKLLEEHPELRDILIEKYGIDILNPDGSINYDKLRILLMMDQLAEGDQFDVIDLISKTYNIEVPSMEELNNLAKLLLDVLKVDPSLRDYLLKRYGFDIFNEDGTINFDKLRIALMMDKISKDDFDLLSFLMGKIKPTSSTVTPSSPKITTDATTITQTKIDGIDDVNNLKTVEVSPIEEPIIEPYFDDYIEPSTMEDNYSSYETETKPKEEEKEDKKSNLLGIAAGVGLAVGAAAYGAYKLTKDEEDTENEDKE